MGGKSVVKPVRAAAWREKEILTLDLNFLGVPHAIASYLIPHNQGAVLVESGPGSTQAALQQGLNAYGLGLSDITDVLLTHIHLDHAGAAGWLARHGARIHVHPVGAPHLINPEKLLASAQRIYGDLMETLWGQFLPVPESRLSVVKDGQVISVGGLEFRALETPGHAEHHYAYRYEDTLFTGDIGGVRLPGPPHIRLPMPPPEFHYEKWRLSLRRLEAEGAERIAPTHFGIYEDPAWHLAALDRALDELESWMEEVMPLELPAGELNRRFLEWSERRSRAEGLDDGELHAYETANPSWMSSAGIQRYWQKNRQ
jgi:glyoxylase-like metal-dependent hydrolase (beta-lactamase superfamily II)